MFFICKNVIKIATANHMTAIIAGGAIDSRDIVDGHREKSITLLWKIIFAFQVLY